MARQPYLGTRKKPSIKAGQRSFDVAPNPGTAYRATKAVLPNEVLTTELKFPVANVRSLRQAIERMFYGHSILQSPNEVAGIGKDYLEYVLDDAFAIEGAHRVLKESIDHINPKAGGGNLEIILSSIDDVEYLDRVGAALTETIRLYALQDFANSRSFERFGDELMTLLRDCKDNSQGADAQKALDMKTRYPLPGPYRLGNLRRPDKIVGKCIAFYRDLMEYLNPLTATLPRAIRWAVASEHFVVPERFDNSGKDVKEGVRVLRRHMDLAYYTYDADEDISFNGFDETNFGSNVVVSMYELTKGALNHAVRQNKPIEPFTGETYQQLFEDYSQYFGVCKRHKDGAALQSELTDNRVGVNANVEMHWIEHFAYEYMPPGTPREQGVSYIREAFENYQNVANVRLKALTDVAKKAFGTQLGIDPNAEVLDVYRIIRDYEG